MEDSVQVQKTPCYKCIVRAACRGRKIIICSMLASYIRPGYTVDSQRVKTIRKILPRVEQIKFNHGPWLAIPIVFYL